MAGHSRSKNGVASLAYVPAIHAFFLLMHNDVDARAKPWHDGVPGIRRLAAPANGLHCK